jgi:glycosyltransferase involved in cell wall biosynthesis
VNELRAYGIRDKTKIIYHGVDLEVYKPLHDEGGLFMYGATSNRKGLDIIQAIMALLPDHPIEAMNEYSCVPENKARRLNDAMCLLAPTRHEGNAYLLIEALACGVPLIAFRTGLACEMDERCGHITDDIAPQNFVRLMVKAENPLPDFEGYDSRGWAEEHCDYETFAREWRSFLDLS